MRKFIICGSQQSLLWQLVKQVKMVRI